MPDYTPPVGEQLLALKGDSIAAESIRQGAATDLNETVRMIKDQIRDGNRMALVDLLGTTLVTQIEKL